jgi:O-antigen/teichoic acid export membrane protein
VAELRNKFIFQLLLSATQVLLPLASYPYITRILGPENLGKVNYVDFVSQLFIILAVFGIPFYAVREIALQRNNAAKRAELIKELVLLQSIFAVTAGVFFVLFTWNHWAQSPVLYLLGLANILISAFSFEWYIQGMEHFRFASIRTVLVRLVMLASFFILVKNREDYAVYFGIFCAGMLLIALLNGWKLIKENHFSLQPASFKKHLLPLWHFFLTSSAISIYIYFDTIILRYITGSDEEVGYYSTVLKMVKIFLVVIIALGTVLMPRMSYLASTGKTAEMRSYANNLLQFILVASLPVCCGLFMLAPEIIQAIAGDQFLPAIPLMRILAFLPLVIGLSNLFCFQTLVPFKQERKFLLAAIAGCIASVSLNFLLVPYWGATGSAYACIATELIITLITGILAHKLIRFKLVPVVLIQTIGCTLLLVPVILLCKNLFAAPLLILTTAVPACILVYTFTQYRIFNNQIIAKMKTYIFNLLKS